MIHNKQVHPLLSQRRSIFSFSDVPVEEEDLHLLFDAARKAPSSFNAQPWNFVYASKTRQPDQFNKLFDLLSNGNKVWAGSASVLILTLAETLLPLNGKPNAYALHDLGLATANLFLQATLLGLATHPMGGFDKTKAREVLNIPEIQQPGVMIALGYPGNHDHLPEDIKKRLANAGKRKEIDEFVFKDVVTSREASSR